MKFQEEILTEAILKESESLLQKHWAEIAHYKDIALDPDYEMYLKLQAAGSIRTYLIRDDDGKMIGYAVYVVGRNAHYKQTMWARQDILFIDPVCRGGGLKFIAWCDDELRKIGIDIVSHHVKLAHDFSRALERMGYEKQDVILTRRLNNGR